MAMREERCLSITEVLETLNAVGLQVGGLPTAGLRIGGILIVAWVAIAFAMQDTRVAGSGREALR